jgi:hypothetical protein
MFFLRIIWHKNLVFLKCFFFSFARDRLKAREIDIQEEKIRLKFKKYCRHAEKLNIFFSSKEQDTICFYIFVCVCVCAFYHKSKDEIEEKNVQI